MTSTDQTVQHPGLVPGTGAGRDAGLGTGGRSRVVATTMGAVGAGLLLGAGWGIAARVWMRLVSTMPGFSWTGTLFIIGLAALAGGCLGLVHAAWRRGGSRWWRVAALPSLLLFFGPGVPCLPAYLLGGWAWGSRRVPAVLRALAVLPRAGLPFYGWATSDWTVQQLISPYVAIGGFLVLEVALAAAGAVLFRPWPKRAAVVTSGTDPAVE
jgi:hypothetical protein